VADHKSQGICPWKSRTTGLFTFKRFGDPDGLEWSTLAWRRPAGTRCGFAFSHLRFPVTHRRAIRTTNLLERLFVEERRRLKIIPNAFGERAVLKLMFGALIQ
jgi:hypothetical protein